MKNLKSTEPIYLDKKYGWCADIYQGEKSSAETDICIVWGSTEEELNYRVTMIKKSYEIAEILKKLYNDSFIVSGPKVAKIATTTDLVIEISELINELKSWQ